MENSPEPFSSSQFEVFSALRENMASVKTNLEWTVNKFGEMREEHDDLCQVVKKINDDSVGLSNRMAIQETITRDLDASVNRRFTAIDQRLSDIWVKQHAIQKKIDDANRYIWIGIGACSGITLAINILFMAWGKIF